MLCLLACGVLLGCAELSLGGFIPQYNLSITNHRNRTNEWLELKIEHQDEKSWDMLLAHSHNFTAAKITQENVVASSKKSPPPGYQRTCGTSYYKVYGKGAEKTWLEAESVCESEGGHLIVIDSEEELTYMKITAFKHVKQGTYFSVGIHDQYKEGDYVTVLNKTMESTRYSTWYPGGFPNGGTSQNCAYFAYEVNTHVFGVDDTGCTSKNGFICEIEDL